MAMDIDCIDRCTLYIQLSHDSATQEDKIWYIATLSHNMAIDYNYINVKW